MKLKSKLGLIVLLMLFGLRAFAQGPSAPTNADLILEPSSPVSIAEAVMDTLTNPFDLLGSADTLNYTLVFSCPDTSTVDSIFAIVGTSDGGSQLATINLDWDPSSPPSGITYLRAGHEVYVKIDNLLFNDPVYYEVYLKDGSGNSSALLKYNTLN